MKHLIFKSLVCALPFTLCANEVESEEEDRPDDQAQFCFGANYFAVCKAISMAEKEGFPYVKILSYDIQWNKERLHFSSGEEVPEGTVRFTFAEDEGTIEIACFREEREECLTTCV